MFKLNGWLIIAAGIIFYVGVNTIVKAVDEAINPKKKKE